MAIEMESKSRFLRTMILPAVAAVLVWAHVSRAETYGFKGPLQRRIQITREYDVPASKGQKTVAGIPALMSFWGRRTSR